MQDTKPIIIIKARFRVIIWRNGAVSGHTSISVHRFLNEIFVLRLLTNLTHLFHTVFTPARSLRSMLFYMEHLLINCFQIQACTIRLNVDLMYLTGFVQISSQKHLRESTYTRTRVQIQSVKKIVIAIND